MGKEDNFMDGLKHHWKNKPSCSCLNCKKFSMEKKEYLKEES